MAVGYIPEQIAGRIVNIQDALSSAHALRVEDRVKLIDEQSRLWDEVFPGQPYEVIAGMAKPIPFMLAH